METKKRNCQTIAVSFGIKGQTREKNFFPPEQKSGGSFLDLLNVDVGNDFMLYKEIIRSVLLLKI